jgi:hypothetical protein
MDDDPEGSVLAVTTANAPPHDGLKLACNPGEVAADRAFGSGLQPKVCRQGDFSLLSGASPGVRICRCA